MALIVKTPLEHIHRTKLMHRNLDAQSESRRCCRIIIRHEGIMLCPIPLYKGQHLTAKGQLMHTLG